MAEYLIQDTTLTSLGNKIRVLTGETNTMSPTEMGAELDTANTEVSTQASLISQIAAALEGKIAGGGSAPETATVKLTSFLSASYGVWYMDAAGIQASNNTVTSFTCIAPSILSIRHGNGTITTTGSVMLLNNSNELCIFSVTGDGTITIKSNSGSD